MKKMTTLMLAALAYAGASAFAADYPNKPVRFIVAFPPGSATDIVGRLYTQKWTEMWGHQVIADNRPGAGGSIAAAIAAKSTADGYTLLMHSSGHTVNPSLYAKLPFDTLKDIVPVASTTISQVVISVNPAVPVKNVREFIDYAKKQKDGLNVASPGQGSIGHLSAGLLAKRAGINIVYVPYQGGGPAINALLNHDVDFYFGNASELL
ncbi:MAG: tripartite tricarboxylate transporter substrate-binding protein, partial [Burkholderiales bacterium]